MKRCSIFLLFFLSAGSFINSLFSQAPTAFQYQAVIRNGDGEPVANALISLRVTILSDTILNIADYSEVHETQTDDFGKVAISIGNGTPSGGSFESILWESGTKFLKLEIDPEAGGNFQYFGTTRLLSVPYALYASQAPNSLTEGAGIDITGNVISNTGDLSPSNELQTLSKFGDSILLSNGGGSVTDADNQTLSVTVNGTNRQLQVSGGNSVIIDVADNDNSTANELQILSISHDTVYLSNGGYVKLPVPVSAIVPSGGCIQSTSVSPPSGYSYSGNSFEAGDEWNILPSMSYSRFGPMVAAVGTKIYVMGGWDGYNTVSNIVEMYDVQAKTWTRKANMPFGVVYAASAVAGNNIYVMGGYDGTNAVTRNQVYNTVTNAWSQAAALLSPRSGCKAGEFSGKIHLIGGYYNSSALSTHEMFDPASGNWTSKTAMTTARTDFALAVLNGGIYCIGGWNADVLNTNEYYNPTTNTWTTCYPMPDYRSGMCWGVVNSKIYVIGGGDTYSYSSRVGEYDPQTNEWKTMNYLPAPRSFSGAVVIDNKIYMAGGNFGLALNSCYEYNPLKTRYYLHCVP